MLAQRVVIEVAPAGASQLVPARAGTPSVGVMYRNWTAVVLRTHGRRMRTHYRGVMTTEWQVRTGSAEDLSRLKDRNYHDGDDVTGGNQST
jgi:hypothetical protein